MNTFRKYFMFSGAVTAIGLILGFMIGGLQGAIITAILGVLEVSLSLDNAVVNAKKLEAMNEKGRRWFLRWGMLIAVFGMRLVFPIAIVAIIAGLGPIAVVTMAIERPAEYAAVLASSHHQVAAFGGAFLFMVFLKFMMDHEKESHWLGWFEAPLAKIGKLDMIQSVITLIALLVASLGLHTEERLGFIEAGIVGLIVYIVVDGIGGLLEEYDEAHDTSGKKILDQSLRAALPGLLYLEVLDASMSFDGVIGAFALSSNIFIIMIGLGIGAMFVRSLTIMLVDKGTLAEFRYLEHGAFWAIGVLATTMLLSVKFDLPEWFVGLTGAVVLTAAVITSIVANRRDAANGIAEEDREVAVGLPSGAEVKVTEADLKTAD